jgi:hypothetical protein
VDVVQNLVLKTIIIKKYKTACGAICGKPPQEGRFQIQFPVGFLRNIQATFSFCPHSAVLESTQPLKEQITKEFPWG